MLKGVSFPKLIEDIYILFFLCFSLVLLMDIEQSQFMWIKWEALVHFCFFFSCSLLHLLFWRLYKSKTDLYDMPLGALSTTAYLSKNF